MRSRGHTHMRWLQTGVAFATAERAGSDQSELPTLGTRPTVALSARHSTLHGGGPIAIRRGLSGVAFSASAQARGCVVTAVLMGVVAVAIIVGMVWLMMRIDRASSQRIERRREAWGAGGSIGPGPGGCSGGGGCVGGHSGGGHSSGGGPSCGGGGGCGGGSCGGGGGCGGGGN